MSPASILSVRDVTVRFGGIVALENVGFDVEAGQIVGLIGPNGAGKTTLFNCLSRLYTPDRGDIRFHDRSLLAVAASPHRRPRHRAHLPEPGPVPHDDRAPERDGGRALPHPQRLLLQRAARCRGSVARSGPPVATADDLLAFLALERVADHPAAGLPFGTLKRVELARALAGRPALLLADEPAAGLNHEEVGALGAILKSIRDDRGVTVLLVEHHMGLVMQVSDRVVVLDFGRKIAEGPPAEIQRNADVIRAYLGGEDAETAFR